MKENDETNQKVDSKDNELISKFAFLTWN